MSTRISHGACAVRVLISLLIASTVPTVTRARAEEALAVTIADGKPWEMYIVKRKVSHILVFRPDGGGTITDSVASIKPTWRATPDGICIRPAAGEDERCVELARTSAGISGSQGGKVIWVLKR